MSILMVYMSDLCTDCYVSDLGCRSHLLLLFSLISKVRDFSMTSKLKFCYSVCSLEKMNLSFWDGSCCCCSRLSATQTTAPGDGEGATCTSGEAAECIWVSSRP